MTTFKMMLTAAAAAAALTGLGQGGFTSAAQAQTQPINPDGRPDYAAVQADPAMWVVRDADSTVYLFGSFHLLPPALDWRTEPVDAALAEADTVWFEADAFSDDAQAQMQALLPQLGFNPPGVALSDLIDEDARADLAEVAGMLGAEPAALAASLDPMRPWLASLQIAVAGIQALGYDPNSGVERVLHVEAEAAGKAFDYFETAEQQMRFFADLPLEVQVAELERALEEMAEEPDMIEALAVAWAEGDVAGIDAMVNASMRDSGSALYEVIIVQRNRDWIPQIVEILDGEGVDFVAVGAAHMPGDQGVIALLEAEGYAVERR